MNIYKLRFYKVLKNEDAMPYIYAEGNSGFIVAADGLGGSGSFVHQLTEEGNKNLKSLLNSMLPEYRPDELQDKAFNAWIDELIEPMQDGKPDTSALWGSRVVISRLACYLHQHRDANLADENVRKDIIKFIYDGMDLVISEFKLKTGEMSGQLTLPTTLVGIKYEVMGDHRIHAEVFWAGDSRAYALIPGQGLKQLSRDDEDQSGAIDNLFAVKQGVPVQTRLNYKSYTLPKKSCIFVCSDGFFDPYDPNDNIGVEAVLLNCMIKATTFDDFGKKWYDHYEPMGHDDCSVAFLAFELDSFAELKNMYAARANKVITAFDDYFLSYKKFIPIVTGEEDNPETYVITRAKSRLSEIANRIANECMTNWQSADVTVTKAIKDIVVRLKRECRERSEEKVKAKKKDIIDQIVQALLNDPLNLEKIFNTKRDVLQSIGTLVDAARKVIAKREKYVETRNQFDKACEKRDRVQKEKDGLKAKIIARQQEIEKAKNMLRQLLLHCEEAYKWVKHNYSSNSDVIEEIKSVYQKYQRVLDKAEIAQNALEKLKSDLFQNSKISTKLESEVYFRDRELVESARVLNIEHGDALHDISVADKEMKIAAATMEGSESDYKSKVNSFAQNMDFYIDSPDENFTEPMAAKIKEQCSVEAVELTVELLASEIERYFNSDGAAFDGIIRSFISSENPTIIDSIFNASRLALCRNYKQVDPEKVRQLIVTVDTLNAGYEDYPTTPTAPTKPTTPATPPTPADPADPVDPTDPNDSAGE